MDNNGAIQKRNGCEVREVTVDFSLEEILKSLDRLPARERLEVVQKSMGKDSNLTVIIGGTNIVNNSVVSNSFALQLGGTAEEVSKQLERISDENFEKLIEAIASADIQNSIVGGRCDRSRLI